MISAAHSIICVVNSAMFASPEIAKHYPMLVCRYLLQPCRKTLVLGPPRPKKRLKAYDFGQVPCAVEHNASVGSASILLFDRAQLSLSEREHRREIEWRPAPDFPTLLMTSLFSANNSTTCSASPCYPLASRQLSFFMSACKDGQVEYSFTWLELSAMVEYVVSKFKMLPNAVQPPFDFGALPRSLDPRSQRAPYCSSGASIRVTIARPPALPSAWYQ